jgi:hypothetical protein
MHDDALALAEPAKNLRSDGDHALARSNPGAAPGVDPTIGEHE